MVINIELSKNEILLVQMPGKCPHSSSNFTILTYQWTLAQSSGDGEAVTTLQQYDPYKGLEDSIIIMNVDNFEKQSLSDNNIYICKKGDDIANVNHLTRFQENLQKKRPVYPDVGVSLSLRVLLGTKPHSSSRTNLRRSWVKISQNCMIQLCSTRNIIAKWRWSICWSSHWKELINFLQRSGKSLRLMDSSSYGSHTIAYITSRIQIVHWNMACKWSIHFS